MGERERWIDAWKGLLILFVVFGHVIGGIRYYVGENAFDVLNHLYTAIYLFHMPAFFVLAGSVSTKSKAQGLKCFVAHKARRLLIPYFTWGFGSAAVFAMLSRFADVLFNGTANGPYAWLRTDVPWWQPFVSIVHAGGWPNGEGFLCNGVLWFLPCMFVVLLLAYGLKSRGLGLRPLLIVLCFVIAGAVKLQGWRYWPWSLDLVPYYMGFFLIGERMATHAMSRRFTVSTPRLLVLLVAGWALYGVLAGMYPNLSYGRQSWAWYGASVALAVGGSVLAMGTARMWGEWRWLEKLGIASLGIMLCHKFIVLPVQCGYRWILPADSWAVSLGAGVVLTGVVAGGAMVVVGMLRKLAPWAIGERRV